MTLKLQEDDFALVDDEEGSSSSIVTEADITRELELFRQQWYDEIHGQAEKSSDAGTRSRVQLLVTSEPSDEDQVMWLVTVISDNKNKIEMHISDIGEIIV